MLAAFPKVTRTRVGVHVLGRLLSLRGFRVCSVHLWTVAIFCLCVPWGAGLWPESKAISAEQYTYTVEIVPDNSEGEGVRKSSTLEVVWDGSNPMHAYWVLDDEDVRGQGWFQRFGKLELPMGPHAGVHGPVITVAWEGAIYPIRVLVVGPWADAPLSPGQSWEAAMLIHEVLDPVTVREIPGWTVTARGRTGQRRVVIVAKDAPRVLDVRETFFIGQGKRHLMTVQLVRHEVLEDSARAAWLQAFEQAERLRQPLGTQTGADATEQPANSATVRDALRAWADSPLPPVWHRLAQTALRQSTDELARRQGLDNARRKALAQRLPEVRLESVVGKAPTRADWTNHVVVLHFWDYRDSPLHEPYGQVGYLDFLQRKYGQQGVHVVGIVTNQLAESETGRHAAATSARRFAQFMNLSYPVVQDGGQLLRQLGDPRQYDGALPLFVVADRTGQIIHYRSGYYPADPQRGLVELESIIQRALQNAP